MSDRKIGLDYLRAAAILLVVTSHILPFWFSAPYNIAHPFGALGVEIFFVLSGFLIGGVFLKAVHQNGDRISPALLWIFWVRRWLRTIPNYLLFIPAYAFLWEGVPLQALKLLTFSQSLAWPDTTVYVVSWSLCVEEWFYLLFPAICFFVFVLSRSVRTSFLIAAAALFVVPLALRIVLTAGKPWDEAVRKVVVYRLDAIIWGVLLAAVYRYKPLWFRWMQTKAIFLLGIAGMSGSVFWVYLRYTTGGAAFITTPPDAFIFCALNSSAALAIPAAVAFRGLHPAADYFASLTSRWSYSMYLAHFPVMFYLYYLLVWIDPSLIPWTAWWAFVTVLLTYAISAGVYYAFEWPILKLRDRWT